MSMHSPKILFLFIASLLGLTAPAMASDLKVVTSFSILADMVTQIGGDAVSVISLVKPDGDAHNFEPSPQDLKTVADADLIITSGLDFEPWMARLVSSAGFKGPVIVASQGISPLKTGEAHHHGHAHGHGHDGHAHKHDHGDIDPHAWQSLKNGQIYVTNITQALAKVAPAQADLLRKRGEEYRARLAALDTWVHEQFAPIPRAQRKVITSHDSFAYFGEAYGVTFLAAAGVGGQSEPSAKALAALVNEVKRENIKILFLENMSSPQVMNALARETGATLGGKLYSDALSAPDGAVPSYEAMFRHNVTLLAAAMQAD